MTNWWLSQKVFFCVFFYWFCSPPAFLGIIFGLAKPKYWAKSTKKKKKTLQSQLENCNFSTQSQWTSYFSNYLLCFTPEHFADFRFSVCSNHSNFFNPVASSGVAAKNIPAKLKAFFFLKFQNQIWILKNKNIVFFKLFFNIGPPRKQVTIITI